MNINHAVELIHTHGNMGRSPEDLLTAAPSEHDLQAAQRVAHMSVDRAVAEIRNHFKMPRLPVLPSSFLDDPLIVACRDLIKYVREKYAVPADELLTCPHMRAIEARLKQFP